MAVEQWLGLGGAVLLVVFVVFAFRKATAIRERDKPDSWRGPEHHTHLTE